MKLFDDENAEEVKENAEELLVGLQSEAEVDEGVEELQQKILEAKREKKRLRKLMKPVTLNAPALSQLKKKVSTSRVFVESQLDFKTKESQLTFETRESQLNVFV